MKKYLFISILMISMVAQAQDYQLIATLAQHEAKVQNLTFSHDGNLLVSGDIEGNIILWSVEKNSLIRSWKGHESIVVDFSFDATGTYLATASTDGTAKVWEVATGNPLGSYENKQTTYAGKENGWAVSFAVFSPDSRFLYYGGDGATIYQVKVGYNKEGNTYKEKAIYTHPTKDYERDKMQRITGGEILPSGGAIVCTIGYHIKVIQISDGQVIKSMYYSREPLNDVVIGPRGGQVTTWSLDGRANIWSVATGEMLSSYEVGDLMEICSPSFSNDRQMIATAASGHEAHVWDIKSHRKIATLMSHKEIVRIAKFSPTENIIATASYDGTIKIWKGPHTETVKEPEPEIEYFGFNGGELLDPEELDLPMLFFDQGEYVLRKNSRVALYHVVEIMKKHTDVKIFIEGHTDDVGNPYVNLNLSRKRAVVVLNFLIENGINDDRVAIVAHGGDKPVYLNTSEESKSRNRRVQMQFARL